MNRWAYFLAFLVLVYAIVMTVLYARARTQTGSRVVAPPIAERVTEKEEEHTEESPVFDHMFAAFDHVLTRTLKLSGGSWQDEQPERINIMRYLRANATVLELGPNIGRSTLTIAALLDDDRRLVAVDSGEDRTIQLLTENRDQNQMHFHIEHAALSQRRMIQKDNSWESQPWPENQPIPVGYRELGVISFRELEAKYALTFDTLVADCEGCVREILEDDPDLLTHIRTILIENDYRESDHYQWVYDLLTAQGFSRVGDKPQFIEAYLR